MAQQARAVTTRQAILRGAAEIFDRYGFGSTTLSDIISQSGVTKGSLYFHFRSKEDLAKAIIDAYQTTLLDPSLTAQGDTGSGLEAMITLSRVFAERLQTDVIVRAGVRLTLEQGTFGALSSDSYQQWMEVVERLVRRAVDEDDLRAAVDPPSLARLIIATFTGVQLTSQVFTGRADLGRRVREMWEVLLPSLVPARKLAFFRQVARGYPDAASAGDCPPEERPAGTDVEPGEP